MLAVLCCGKEKKRKTGRDWKKTPMYIATVMLRYAVVKSFRQISPVCAENRISFYRIASARVPQNREFIRHDGIFEDDEFCRSSRRRRQNFHSLSLLLCTGTFFREPQEKGQNEKIPWISPIYSKITSDTT